MTRKWAAFYIVIFSIFLLTSPATARLATVGPVNPISGFPEWYQDTNGVTLDLPVPPKGDPAGLIPPTMIFSPPDPVNFPFSATIGWDQEAFYFFNRARIDTPAGRAEFVAGLEASFVNGNAVSGEQIVFTRVRIRVPIPASGGGTYTVRHPYGTQIFTNVRPGARGINSTLDIGLVPNNFALALAGTIGPFLQQVTPPPPPPDPLTGDAWIGDGVNLATVSGSPVNQNYFRITGPNVGGPGVDVVETNLFVTSGHLLNATAPVPQPPALPLSDLKTTFTRTATGAMTFQFFATTSPGATVTASVPGIATPITLSSGTPVVNNTYFGTYSSPVPIPLRGPVTYTATLGTGVVTGTTGAPVDTVTVSTATYSARRRDMVVRATSTDARAVLTVASPPLGPIRNGILRRGIRTAPVSITVSSSSGGSATVNVTPIR